MISLWLSGSVVALLGCGGDQHYGDCRDAAKSCDTPFVCQLDDEAQSEEWTCSSPKEFVQTCSTSPSQLPAFAMSSDGPPTQVPQPARCLPVSYDKAAAQVAALIEGAVERWNAVPCSSVCFKTPVPSEQDPDIVRRERRVHFKVGPMPIIYLLAPTVVFDNRSGWIFSTTVTINVDSIASFKRVDALRALGTALGLQTYPSGSQTIMLDDVSQERPFDDLTANDEQAACAMYGNPPHCAQPVDS